MHTQAPVDRCQARWTISPSPLEYFLEQKELRKCHELAATPDSCRALCFSSRDGILMCVMCVSVWKTGRGDWLEIANIMYGVLPHQVTRVCESWRGRERGGGGGGDGKKEKMRIPQNSPLRGLFSYETKPFSQPLREKNDLYDSSGKPRPCFLKTAHSVLWCQSELVLVKSMSLADHAGWKNSRTRP